MVRSTPLVLAVVVVVALALGGCPPKPPPAAQGVPVVPVGPGGGPAPTPPSETAAPTPTPSAAGQPTPTPASEARPDAAKPDATKPDAAKPGAATPAAGKPAAKPEAAAASKAAGGLTTGQVKSFLVSMEDKQVKAVMDKLGQQAGITDRKTAASSAAMPKVFAAAAKNPELGKLVKAHGFKDATEWVATAKLVFPGVGHAKALAGGLKEGSKEFEAMANTSEFGEVGKAFAKPTAEQQKVIDAAVAELAKGRPARHKAK